MVLYPAAALGEEHARSEEVLSPHNGHQEAHPDSPPETGEGLTDPSLLTTLLAEEHVTLVEVL